MHLELSNGEVLDDPSPEQIDAALQLLDAQQHTSLALHKSPASILRVVNEQPRRYHLYHDSFRTSKRAIQPVSLQIARRTTLAFAQGQRAWQGGVRFETSEYTPEDEPLRAVEEMGEREIELKLRRLELVGLLPLALFTLALLGFVLYSLPNGDARGDLFGLAGPAVGLVAALVVAVRARQRLRAELKQRQGSI